MAQDIRKMFKEDDSMPFERPAKGHHDRFRAKLEEAFPREQEKNSNRFYLLKIAAIFVVVLGVGFFYLNREVAEVEVVETQVEQEKPATENYQLSDVSPEFKKVEDFYLASLNIELAKLEVNEENKELVDSFMAQLAELDKEYQRLNAEIQEMGINESSLEAMIANLQLRLDLLHKLKTKIKDINLKKNKNYENLQA